MSDTAFFTSATVQGMARAVYNATRIPVSVILAQMAIETAYGTSNLWLNCHNPAGINGPGTGVCQGFASYPSYAAAASGYAATYHNGYYARVLAAAASGASPNQVAVALGQSPWAESHYQGRCGTPGCQLIQVMQTFHLTRYDVPTTHTTNPIPTPTTTPGVWVPMVLLAVGLLGLAADESVHYDARHGRWPWERQHPTR